MITKMNLSSLESSQENDDHTLQIDEDDNDEDDLTNSSTHKQDIIETFNFDCTFATAASLEEYIKEYADKNGFAVNKSFTNKELQISESENKIQICVRGYFLCKQLCLFILLHIYILAGESAIILYTQRYLII